MTIIGAYKAMGPDVVMQYIGGSLLIGGLVLSLLGYSKLIGHVRKFITRSYRPYDHGNRLHTGACCKQFNAANYWPISLLVVALVSFSASAARTNTAIFLQFLALSLLHI